MARTTAEVVNTFLTRAQDAARKGAFSSSLDSSREKLLQLLHSFLYLILLSTIKYSLAF
jgi:hypothetical protein